MDLLHEDQAVAVAGLETRLVEFYNTFTGYDAFNAPPEYPVLWGEVLRLARARPDKTRPCRVLEIGAGRSGFGRFLRAQNAREEVYLTSQDITTANLAHLRESSDEVVTGNIDSLAGSWDLIFHSYVYEHLCRPREFNERLWSLLGVGGHLLIQCPRYDFPLYFPPAWDHLPLPVRVWQAVRLAGGDLLAAGGHAGERFTVFSDPAVFHLPFVRDRDAVHRVRKSDLQWLFGDRAAVREFDLVPGSTKDWIVKKLLTLRVVLQKKGVIPPPQTPTALRAYIKSCWFLFAFAALAVGLGVCLYASEREFIDHATHVPGKIVGNQRTRGKSSDHFNAIFAFTDGTGKTWKATDRGSNYRLDPFPVGQVCAVLYAPDDPAEAQLETANTFFNTAGYAVIPGFAGIFIGTLALFILRQHYATLRRMRANGDDGLPPRDPAILGRPLSSARNSSSNVRSSLTICGLLESTVLVSFSM